MDTDTTKTIGQLSLASLNHVWSLCDRT